MRNAIPRYSFHINAIVGRHNRLRREGPATSSGSYSPPVPERDANAQPLSHDSEKTMRQKSLSAGTPGFSSQVLKQIAQDLGTPTYVYSATLLKKNYRELVRGLKDVDHRIFFAMKANSNLSVWERRYLRLQRGIRRGTPPAEFNRVQTRANRPRFLPVQSGCGRQDTSLYFDRTEVQQIRNASCESSGARPRNP